PRLVGLFLPHNRQSPDCIGPRIRECWACPGSPPMQRHWMPLSNGTMGATLSKSCSRAGALLLHAECEMERHVLSVIPDRSGWVLVDGGLPVEWFRTRQGAI